MTFAHHKTVDGARLALTRGQISADNYRAVITRRLTLAEAKKRGPEGSQMHPEVEGFEDLVRAMRDLGTRRVREAYERAFNSPMPPIQSQTGRSNDAYEVVRRGFTTTD